MKKIGLVVTEVGKFAIVKSDRYSKKLLGRMVYDDKGVIGKIVDIIGPVRSPYLKVLKKRNSKVKGLIYVRG